MIIEVDNAAWASGIWTSGLTGVGAVLTTPENASAWQWLAGLMITGLFGIASAVAAVVARHYLNELKNRKEKKREKEGD